MRSNYYYLEVQYEKRHLHLGFRSKATARKWYESIQNCIKYCQYIQNKLSVYDTQKVEKSILQIMTEKSN